jgi:hypothetical protein
LLPAAVGDNSAGPVDSGVLEGLGCWEEWGVMSAESFGAHMPATLTLDDLAAMAAADEHGHRFEMSPEGVLSVMPPAGVAHTIIASRLLALPA